MNYAPEMISALGLGYFLGAIPFALILGKMAGLGDIRTKGSGNIGATNVLRIGSKKLALATLLLDGGKGALAVVLARLLFPEQETLAGAGALLGHIFPLWLKFKGGKGVATALGVLLALCWIVGLLACLTWLLVGFLFRYSSLAALAALASAPLYTYFITSPEDAPPHLLALSIFIAIVVFLRHRNNIRRLLNGEEGKIGQKS